jgi:hypothetical protein
MESVNEKSTGYLTVVFKDGAGAEAAPSSARYRIDDVETGTELRDWTNLPNPVASSVEVTLTSADNAITNTTGKDETHVVTVEGTYGPEDKVTGEYLYRLVNLRKYP